MDAHEAILEFQSSPEWMEMQMEFDSKKAGAAAIFAGATKVESFGFQLRKDEPLIYPQKPLGQVSGISFYTRGLDKDAEFAARLGALVLDAKS